MTATFDFPYHTPSDVYPESSSGIKFGRGYTFASEPNGPDQMIFRLHFEAMFTWISAAGTPTNAVKPQLSTICLQEFYESVRMSIPFNYVHWRRGTTLCRFNKPLPPFPPVKNKTSYDIASKARGHQVEAFDQELMMMPV